MTKRRPATDVGASVRQRLYNNSKATGRPFQEVLQYFVMERFLYRLARSPYADKFVLKGALMFTAWRAPASRPTKDIDLLARMENRVEAIVPIIRQICQLVVEPDGIVFDLESLQGRVIKEDADYEGVRVTFHASLDKALVRMQLDLGFGDVVTPAPTITEYPTILEFSAPRLYGYSRETAIAEKFEAMVKLGRLNSRLKDFFDLWMLSRQFDFEGPTLASAIARTFAHRGTAMEFPPVALTPRFASDPIKRTQWRGFLKKSNLTAAPQNLQEVLQMITVFLEPVAQAIQAGQALAAHWQAPGPWKLSYLSGRKPNVHPAKGEALGVDLSRQATRRFHF